MYKAGYKVEQLKFALTLKINISQSWNCQIEQYAIKPAF